MGRVYIIIGENSSINYSTGGNRKTFPAANASREDIDAMLLQAQEYNTELYNTPGSFAEPDLVQGYDDLLDVTGTGIMGYISIEKLGVNLPIYHGTATEVLQVGVGHLEGSSLPVGGPGTHCVLS